MLVTVDFETEAIEGNTLTNPPRPIGVSIKKGDQPSVYTHGSLHEIRGALESIWHGSADPLLFHNAPFDISVACKWLGLLPPRWDRVHDTRFLIYLDDPHAMSMSLKPSAVRIMGLAVDERDELRDWILANCKRATPNTWGAYICEGPVELVKKYAEMDTDLTYQLFNHLIDRVPQEAYDRERELSYHLTRSTQFGIRLAREKLERDYELAKYAEQVCHEKIFSRLGCEFDLASGGELADALEASGEVHPDEWILTEKAQKRSTARPNLIKCVKSPELVDLLSYAGAIHTVIATFMRGWLELSDSGPDPRLHPTWNQVRGDNDYGTRTGRMSCSSPNLQNVPTEFDFNMPKGLMSIPNMRNYLLPEVGCTWVSRDFDGQEMRLLAHYENQDLMRMYQDDPAMDPHERVAYAIKLVTGLDVTRKHAKAISFGTIYGMGVPGLAKTLGIDVFTAEKLRSAYFKVLPGVKSVQDTAKRRGKQRRALTTYGGRIYHAEPSKVEPGGGIRSFEYKLLNYLIQGSAADQTKIAMIDFYRKAPEGQRLLCAVHDEINISLPEGEDDRYLVSSMEYEAAVGLDVPMRTSVKTGTTWGNIK